MLEDLRKMSFMEKDAYRKMDINYKVSFSKEKFKEEGCSGRILKRELRCMKVNWMTIIE
jgi:hypothetical protein